LQLAALGGAAAPIVVGNEEHHFLILDQLREARCTPSAVRVKCLTVEHNFVAETRDALHALLRGHGYQRTEAQWDDWFWLED
jgi:hypothetical protein